MIINKSSIGNNAYEGFYTYDTQNNVIHFKDSENNEYYKTYDENNNLLSYKDLDEEKIHLIKYYDNGQLHQYDSLIIPQF